MVEKPKMYKILSQKKISEIKLGKIQLNVIFCLYLRRVNEHLTTRHLLGSYRTLACL